MEYGKKSEEQRLPSEAFYEKKLTPSAALNYKPNGMASGTPSDELNGELSRMPSDEPSWMPRMVREETDPTGRSAKDAGA